MSNRLRNFPDRPVLGYLDHPIEELSVVLGGPLYQLLVRLRLIRPPCGRIGRSIAVIAGLAWMPLVVLTIADGRFAGGVPVPFLRDFEVQTRLLFALPLMILTELVVYTRMRAVTQHFVERQIVTQNVAPAFEEVLASAIKLKNSRFLEIGLLILVLVGGRLVWREAAVFQSGTWFATLTPSGMTRTPAGSWYLFVSLPLFQFMLLRWYFRIFVWGRFLFQVSRLDLNLVPLHPDRCCGLGFLTNIAIAFAPLLVAQSGLMAGFVANRVVHSGAMLPDFKFEFVALVVFLVAIVLGPLCVFIPKLDSARYSGLRVYGPLASDYVIAFERKWGHGAQAVPEPLLGSADIQSLADLDTSYGIVQEVKLVPFGKRTILLLLILILLPLAPLLLTMFSIEELFTRVLSVVF